MTHTIAHPDEAHTKPVLQIPERLCVFPTFLHQQHFLKDMCGYRFPTFLHLPNGSSSSPGSPLRLFNTYRYMRAIGIRAPRFVRMSRPIDPLGHLALGQKAERFACTDNQLSFKKGTDSITTHEQHAKCRLTTTSPP